MNTRGKGLLLGMVVLLAMGAATAAWSKAPSGPDPVVQKWTSWPHPVTCGALPFDPIAVFSGPTGAERGAGGPERALRQFLRQPGWGWIPKRHWRLVAANRRIAEFVQGRVSPHIEREMSSLSFYRKQQRWKWAGSGGCMPRTVRNGIEAAEWHLWEGELPGPEAEKLEVGIEEVACHGFTDSLERLQKPEVRYTDTAALITFWVRPLGGFATCPAPPPSQYELELPGPLGDRELFDAGTYPPRRIELPESAPRSPEGAAERMPAAEGEPSRLPALKVVSEWPGWPYRASCQELPFAPESVFAEVPEAGLGNSALDRALRRKVRLVGVHRGIHGWRLARRLPGRAAFVRGLPGAELESGHELEYMDLGLKRGRWDLEHYSQKCWLATVRKGLWADPWLLAPHQPALTPETQSIRVIAGAHCSRREKPPVIRGEPRFDQFGQRLVMTLWLRHRGGGAHELCESGLPPWPPLEVELPEPLGYRELFDGGEYPPSPAAVYEEPREIGL